MGTKNPYDSTFPWGPMFICVGILVASQVAIAFIDRKMVDGCSTKTCTKPTVPVFLDDKCVCLEVPR
jgi:hypothetical protein